MKTKSIARFSLLCAMALVLGYFERFIPVAPGIPGVKLGLANTVLLYAVYLMGAKSAMLLMLAKVVLSGFLFAGLSGMLYSLAGGLLSLCVMLLLSRLKDVGIIGVSVGGAVSHNIGQIAVACMVVESRAVLGYLPVLMISAIITGTLTGIAAKYAIAALQKGDWESKTKKLSRRYYTGGIILPAEPCYAVALVPAVSVKPLYRRGSFFVCVPGKYVLVKVCVFETHISLVCLPIK